MAHEAVSWLFQTPWWVPAVLGFVLFFIALPKSRAEPTSVGDYLTPHEALQYIAEKSRWGDETSRYSERRTDPDGSAYDLKKNPYMEGFGEFQAKAQTKNTRIVSVGLDRGEGNPVPIPHTFWLTNGLSIVDVLKGGDGTSPTVSGARPWGQQGDRPFFSSVRIERDGVEATWPRMSWWRRLAAWKRNRSKEKAYQKWMDTPVPSVAEQTASEADYVPMKEASVWFYHNASPRLRKVLREGVPSPFDTIEEHGEALILEATKEGIGTLFGKWEAGLPYEKIKASDIELDAFESTFGIKRKVVSEAAVSRSDLDAILAHYEEDDRERERF